MRALCCDGADSARLERGYPEPSPAAGEAVIRPSLAGICNTDLELANGYMGFSGVLGHEFVGIVESCGDSGLVGARVVGEINCPCGSCSLCLSGKGNHCPQRTVLGIMGRDGVFADIFTLPVGNLLVVPDKITDTQAVFTEPLAAAFEIINQVRIGPGDKVATLGDGKLGLLVGQVISLTGCDLVAVGRHPEKLEILAQRGITTALDRDMVSMRSSFDVVVDATGSAKGFALAVELARPCGTIVLKTTTANPAGLDSNRIVIDELTVIGSRCGPFDKALDALENRLVDVEPMVSEIFHFDYGVEAMKRASEGATLKVLMDFN